MTEWDAVEYSRRSLLQEAMGQEVLALLDLQGSGRILDVGCGDGKITAEIAARVPRGSVVGVDPSRDMISFAQSHYGPATTHNLRFQVADARSLSFQSEFDRVVSFNALHWIPEQNAALSSIHSALISGGKAQLRLVPAGERPELGKCSRSNASSLEMGRLLPGFSQSLSASDTGTVCSRGGAQWLPRPTRFHERSDVGFWVAGGILRFLRRRCVAWTDRLPAAERADFINDVLDRYRAVAADGSEEGHTFKFYQMDISSSQPDETLAQVEGELGRV